MYVKTIGFILLCYIVADEIICCTGKDIFVTQDICDLHNTYSIKEKEEIVLNYYRMSEVNVTGLCTITIEGASNDLSICVHFGHSYMAMSATYVCSERFKYYYTGELHEKGVNCYDFKNNPLCTRERTVKAVYNYDVFGFFDAPLRIKLTAKCFVNTIPTTTQRVTLNDWSDNNYNNNGGYNDYGKEPKKEPKYIFGLKVFGIIIAACIVLFTIIYCCQKQRANIASDGNTRSIDEPEQRWSAPPVEVPTYFYNESQPRSHQMSTHRVNDGDYCNGYIPSQLTSLNHGMTSPSQSTSQPPSGYTDDAPSYSTVMGNKSKYAYDGSSDYQGPSSSGATDLPPTVNQPIPLSQPGTNDLSEGHKTPTAPLLDYSKMPPPPPYPGV